VIVVENRLKLAIMSIVLIISPMPIAIFFLFNKWYISGLLNGTNGIRIELQKGFLEIYSKEYYPFDFASTLRISFLEITLLIASLVVFCISMIYVVKALYNTAIKQKPL
jgi:hypothetical protein